MTTKKPKRPAKRSPRTSTLIRETLDWMHIAERCVEFADDCWLWTGATASKNPIVKMPGRPCMTVRRVVLEMDTLSLAAGALELDALLQSGAGLGTDDVQRALGARL